MDHLVRHSRLENLYEDFIRNQTAGAGEALTAEIVRLTAQGADIIASGSAENGRTNPEGYYGPDGRFYIHIFSGPERFALSNAGHPVKVNMKELYAAAENGAVGGFSLNHRKSGGSVLIPKEDIREGLAVYARLHGRIKQ